ncbi:hypothetical protein [Sphingobium yanoikuyae]|uniref:hypothetical protein n=1 Tax=Sphingobium yanoikuyae TaxID=13690 RepID=UPI0028AEBCB3|nr:hypothetical protein [Sphingobium yanoikuyae]
MTIDDLVEVAEARLARDLGCGDAVNARVEAAEIISRIDQRLILKRNLAPAEADNSDLADAANAPACGLDVDRYEIERVWIDWGGQRAVGWLRTGLDDERNITRS